MTDALGSEGSLSSHLLVGSRSLQEWKLYGVTGAHLWPRNYVLGCLLGPGPGHSPWLLPFPLPETDIFIFMHLDGGSSRCTFTSALLIPVTSVLCAQHPEAVWNHGRLTVLPSGAAYLELHCAHHLQAWPFCIRESGQ